jgi:hypothetical protein
VLHDGSSLDLSRVVLELVGQVVGVLRLAVHDLAEHGRQDLGEDGKDVSLEEHSGGEARAQGRAVHHRKTLLGLQLEEAALDSGNLECLGGVDLAAVWGERNKVLTPSDEVGNVGERHKVSGRSDRAAQRQARRDVGVEQLDDRLEDLEADPRVPLEEGVDADEHGRARRLGREDVAVRAGAEGAGVEEPDELPLESAALLGPPVRHGVEAGGDAVAVGAVHHAVHDPVAACLDPTTGRLVQLDPGLASAGGHLRDAEAGALDLHQGLAVLGHHPEDAAEVDGEVLGSGEPRRIARRRTHARARRRESKRRTHHGCCCHRCLKDGRSWSRNGRRLIGPRSRRQGREGGAVPRRDLGRVNRRAHGVLLDPFAGFLPPAPSDLGLGGGATRPGQQRGVLVPLDFATGGGGRARDPRAVGESRRGPRGAGVIRGREGNRGGRGSKRARYPRPLGESRRGRVRACVLSAGGK